MSFSNAYSLIPRYVFSGDTLLEGLIVNGWLSKVVLARGHVEKSVAMWTFNLSEFICQS